MVRLGAQTHPERRHLYRRRRVENRDLALLPGMTANLQIVTEERARTCCASRTRRCASVRPAAGRLAAALPTAPAASSARAAAARSQPARNSCASASMTELQPTAEQWPAIDRPSRSARARRRAAMPGLSEDGASRPPCRQCAAGSARKRSPPRSIPSGARSSQAIMRERAPARAAGGCRHARPRLHPRPRRPAQPRRAPARRDRWQPSPSFSPATSQEGTPVIVGGGPRPIGRAPAKARPDAAPARSASVLKCSRWP